MPKGFTGIELGDCDELIFFIAEFGESAVRVTRATFRQMFN
jgi:hypothetical protein